MASAFCPRESHHPIQMPDILTTKLFCVCRSEFPSPSPDRFIRSNNSALQQHFLDKAQTQWKPEIQQDRIRDDLLREAVALVADGRTLHLTMKTNTVSTIERHLAALGWNNAQRGTQKLDRNDLAIATVMAGIRNKRAAPPRQKETILPDDLIAILETLDRRTLRGLRDRAMLLVGFAGGLRRSKITGLEPGKDGRWPRLDRDF